MYEKFQDLCAQKGVTIYRVCKDIGISPGGITNWKKRGSVPSTTTLKKIAAYFDVPLDYFINKETPQDVIDRISNGLTAISGGKDSFMEDFIKDDAFVSHIRLLWSLPIEDKEAVYKTIQGLYYRSENESRKKEDALNA